jgi:hypothetical protein
LIVKIIFTLKEKFSECSSFQLSSYFETIQKYFNCEMCNKNINFDLSLCFKKHFEELKDINTIFENVILNLKGIYDKEQIFKKILLNNNNQCCNSLMNKFLYLQILSKNIFFITKVIKVYVYIIFSKFKDSTQLNNDCVMDTNMTNILHELNLFEIYQEILEDVIKKEIILKLGQCKTVHDKPILLEITK